MGSKGTGSFGDYPGSSNGKEPGTTDTGGVGGSGGGQPDKCEKAFSVTLDDVAQYSYYKKYGTVPPVGTQLTIFHQKRLVAQDMSGEGVGALPTSFNYLAACLKSGYTYSGSVTNSRMTGSKIILTVDFVPK